MVGVTISRGELSKILGKVSAALDKPYGELLAALPNEEVVNVDETGHKENRERWWSWCFRAELYTRSRSHPDHTLISARTHSQFVWVLERTRSSPVSFVVW